MTHIFAFLRRALIIAWTLGLTNACAPARLASVPESPVGLTSLPGWEADALGDVSVALNRQCALRDPPAPWPTLCPEFKALPAAPQALRRWLETRFMAWPLRDPQGQRAGLITGYYEPLLSGSRQRDGATQVPLYRRPSDLLTIDLTSIEPRLQGMRLRGRVQGQRVVPYLNRREIELTQPLAGQELVWVDDRVDAFFLEIQGSGRIRLRDGSTMRVGYADQNGHPYRAIGRTLTERGALSADEVTAPRLRRWLRDHPDQAHEVLHSNPSVVFFKELPPLPAAHPYEPEPGPPGALGVALTAQRSLAVDRRVIPLGSLVWLDTQHPLDAAPLRRLMAAQDVGGAIKGSIRADFFWGFGDTAEQAAGAMRAKGQLWVLWPREQPFNSSPSAQP